MGLYQIISTGVMYAEYETYVSTPVQQLEDVIFDPEGYSQWLQLPAVQGEFALRRADEGAFDCTIGGTPWECHFAHGRHRSSIATLTMKSPAGETRGVNFEVWPVNDGEFTGVHVYLLRDASPYQRSFGFPAFNAELRDVLMKNYHTLTERATRNQ